MTKYYTTQDKADTYDAIIDIFDGLFREVKDLGKKKPEATLSASKVKMINRILADAMVVLEDADNHKYLELLDDAALPQYSDAILVMAQFEGALKGFRARHYGYTTSLGRTDWIISEEDEMEANEAEE